MARWERLSVKQTMESDSSLTQLSQCGEGRNPGAMADVRQHRIPPRSPNLNAFVERFQGTVLHLHYRVAFRYRYYTSITTIDADLGAFLRFYNYERPHRGYRTRGRTPASIFFSQQPEYLSQMGA